MGSFANSVHIKSDDALAVTGAVVEILQAEGARPTERELDEEALWGFSTSLRGIEITEARDGWIGVLDSDLMGSASLAQELSRRFGTHALQVLVNDSDSWYYALYHDGNQMDEFDSSGAFEGDFDGEEFSAELGSEQMAALSELQDRAQKILEDVQSIMPADMRAIQQKMMTGQVTSDEMQRYATWAQQEMPRLMDRYRDSIRDLLPNALPRSAQAPDLDKHCEALRPVSRPGISDEQLRQVLGKQAEIFAETVLQEFLPLLGIAPTFANLSYRYLQEYSESQLAAAGIRFVHHLKFDVSE